MWRATLGRKTLLADSSMQAEYLSILQTKLEFSAVRFRFALCHSGEFFVEAEKISKS
jgi:hypothetical protein